MRGHHGTTEQMKTRVCARKIKSLVFCYVPNHQPKIRSLLHHSLGSFVTELIVAWFPGVAVHAIASAVARKTHTADKHRDEHVRKRKSAVHTAGKANSRLTSPSVSTAPAHVKRGTVWIPSVSPVVVS